MFFYLDPLLFSIELDRDSAHRADLTPHDLQRDFALIAVRALTYVCMYVRVCVISSRFVALYLELRVSRTFDAKLKEVIEVRHVKGIVG